MTTTLADLENWVEEMMKKRAISDYKLDLAGGSSKGDGYLGEVNFVKVVASLGNDAEKVYELVVKSAKKGEEFRKQTPIQEAYYREMFMYTKVFPIFIEFQKENNIENSFEKFPKCYSVCNEDNKEALVLKNLKFGGFEIHDRTSPQNFEHVSYTFQNYGKFHGLSMALKRKKPAVFKNLTKNMTDVLGQFIKQSHMENKFREDFVAVLDILKKTGKERVAQKLEGISNEIAQVLTNFTPEENQEFAAILHGDCWNNNMMFKYKAGNKTKPVDMCFIDFQLSRLASPIFDLSYYLYTVADRKVLEKFDQLLRIYHTSLSEYLKEFSIDVDEIVTFEELKKSWKKYGKFGLAMSPFIVKIELCQTDEVVDMAECAEKGNLQNAFDIKIKDQDVYEGRMVHVMEHWVAEFCE